MGWINLFLASWGVFVVSACKLHEFSCANGECVSASRYCDGDANCADGSDEPPNCSSCNRTFFGESNEKYSLRITSPSSQPRPFNCKITFSAQGKKMGDRVQLNFVSFELGTLDNENSGGPLCLDGFMKVEEPSGMTSHLRSQQTRGFSQLMSALKEPSKQLATLYDIAKSDPVFGNTCRQLIGRSATFISEGNNATISLYLSPNRSQSLKLILTYKFISKTSIDHVEEPPRIPLHLGTKSINTYCDRVFVNCDKKQCIIRSPNFPGFYLRNITCNYWIRQDTVPAGLQAQIVLSQTNDYKISIYTGKPTTAGSPFNTLTTDCAADVIRVFDGPNDSEPLLTEFCGSGTLNEIISSSSEILVQLYSAPEQLLHNSRVEMDVSIRFINSSEFRATKRCHFVISSANQRRGTIYTPRHTLPPNTTCTFHLLGSSPTDRVWLYFLSFYIEDQRQWSRKESCELGKLEIFDTYFKDKNTTIEESTYRFCEKSYPKICARAADHPASTPVRPCSYPGESYLSSGPELILRQDISRSSDVSSSSSKFLATFEFVETSQQIFTVNGTVCDRIIESMYHRSGSITSPRNIFLFGRGGRENVTCSYSFNGQLGERLKLNFTNLNLKSLYCEDYYNSTLQRHLCKVSSHNRLATIKIIEYWGEIVTAISCFCNKNQLEDVISIETVSPVVKIVFSINEMTPYEDFMDYYFEASYEFIQSNSCDQAYQQKSMAREGEMSFSVPPWVEGNAPLRCRWFVEASPQKYLYLKFRGYQDLPDCKLGNMAIVYTEPHFDSVAVVCMMDGIQTNEIDVFSSSWHNETSVRRHRSHRYRDHVFVEIIASVPGKFSFRWLEVTKPFLRTQSGQTLRNINCLYECPQLNACISPELWCDGVVHCPSGYDETPGHCHQLPILYIIAGATAALLVVFTIIGIITHRCQRRGKLKQSRPLPTDDQPMGNHHIL